MELGRVGYFLCMVLATVAAGWIYRSDRRSASLTKSQRIGIAIGGIVGATFAAKLPFLMTGGGSVVGTWLSDGKTVLWGLAGGYLGVEVAKWSLYVQERTGDRFVVPVAVAIAIGRLGCLCFGCCFGVPTDQSWGVRSSFADGGELLRHPAPLYESLFHAGFAFLAWRGIRAGLYRDCWMLIYLVSYAAFRFVSEWWRCETNVLWGMTFYQVSAAMIGGVFAVLLRLRTTT